MGTRGPALLVSLFLAVICKAAVSAPVQYPQDVDAFITRVGHCSSLAKANPALSADWQCRKIFADRTALTVKYRNNAAVISALYGNWVKVVERVGPPIAITPSITLNLKGGSYLELSDGKIWSDGKQISCVELKEMAPYLFRSQKTPLLTKDCKLK